MKIGARWKSYFRPPDSHFWHDNGCNLPNASSVILIA
jgi:hypothetical protein